jgi:hypothetical protein
LSKARTFCKQNTPVTEEDFVCKVLVPSYGGGNLLELVILLIDQWHLLHIRRQSELGHKSLTQAVRNQVTEEH